MLHVRVSQNDHGHENGLERVHAVDADSIQSVHISAVENLVRAFDDGELDEDIGQRNLANWIGPVLKISGLKPESSNQLGIIGHSYRLSLLLAKIQNRSDQHKNDEGEHKETGTEKAQSEAAEEESLQGPRQLTVSGWQLGQRLALCAPVGHESGS